VRQSALSLRLIFEHSGSWPRLTGANGSVFQWIEFQIPILKMQVRFLPGLQNIKAELVEAGNSPAFAVS
jgi:hypothetical protein